MTYFALTCRCLIGVLFAASAFSKMRSAAAFRDFSAWLGGLPLPAVRGRAVPAVMAGTEAVIVVALLLPWTARAGLGLAAASLAVFAGGTVAVVRRGVRAPCRCFGTSARPLGLRHAGRDLLLCAAAGAAAASGGAAARPAAIALSLAAGLIAAAFVLFLDDITALFA
jgi:methylamine utilization protein MauE